MRPTEPVLANVLRSAHNPGMEETEEVSEKMHFCCGSSAAFLHLQHLRIVLLSDRLSGKPSAASIILGPECSGPNTMTLQCVRRQGEAAGRQLTLIEAQAWRDYEYPVLKTTPRFVKQEMLTSVVTCAPGPHAFLLVIHEDMVFSEDMRDAVSDHLAVLGETAWNHAIVLFITYEPLAEKAKFTVKGKMLQWLVEKCGDRYHVLNVNDRCDTQVAELLEKVEEVVAGNGGFHFEMDRDILEAEEKRGKSQKLLADERLKTVQRQRYTLQSVKGSVHLPELGIVLLGSKGSGKSSCGNTILGREEFQVGQRSAVCVLRQGLASGRQLTVVEAPGWQGCCPPECSPHTVDREILRSQSLCGPQQKDSVALLLVLRADECFSETFRRPVEGLLDQLDKGEGVWDRTMVLFTCGDWLGDATIEQHIESEGEALRWLMEKCGNRYHVLKNNNNNNNTQVGELLDKIEEMVAESVSQHSQRDRGLMQEDKDTDVATDVKTDTNVDVDIDLDMQAEEMKRRMMEQRENIRATHGITQFPDLRIILLGYRRAGKSSTGNTILGRQAFERCSSDSSVRAQGEVAGRALTLIEPPTTAPFLRETLPSPGGAHAFLLLVRIDTGFDEFYRQILVDEVELLGEQVWKHILVVFTFGDWLGDTTSIEQHIVREGVALQWLIEKCGNRYHMINNNYSNRDIYSQTSSNHQVVELLEKVEEMVAMNGGVTFEY